MPRPAAPVVAAPGRRRRWLHQRDWRRVHVRGQDGGDVRVGHCTVRPRPRYPLLPLANAIVWFVVPLRSTGDVAPAVHNFGVRRLPFD